MRLIHYLKAFERARLRPLVQAIAGRRGRAAAPARSEDLDQLDSVEAKRPVSALPRLALLSVLPPVKSGLATYAATYFQAPAWQVDHVAPVSGAEHLKALQQQLGTPTRRVFSHHHLPALLAQEAYDACLLQIGNSEHHVELVRAWSATRSTADTWIYLHEAQLVRFWRAWCAESPKALLQLYRQAYSDRKFRLEDLFMPQEVAPDTPLGIRLLPVLFGTTRIIVNSEYCARLVREDLGNAEVDLRVLFHPIPAFAPPPRLAPSPLRVGHFGSPNSAKGLAMVIETLKDLQAQSPCTLVLCGYGAARYARRHGLDRVGWVEVHDNPSDGAFLHAMEGVHLGIQLRPTTQGESSGVVSQLLGMGKPVITSAVGSFLEYGEALVLLRPNAQGSELAQAVARVQTHPNLEAIKAIAARLSLPSFQARLGEILGLS